MSPRIPSRRPSVRQRRVMVSAALGVVFASAVGCGETGKITVSDAAPVTVPSSTTTTTAKAPTTTEAFAGTGDESTTTTPGGSGGVSATAEVEATDASWTASPGEYRGQDGVLVGYTCPPGGTLSTIWGTGPFTDDSSVCTAAVFAGLIGTEGGGRVVVRIAPGESTYPGGTANGVTASEYGTWAGSFTFP